MENFVVVLVIDPTINDDMIEMYANAKSRAEDSFIGVFEEEYIFRDLIKTNDKLTRNEMKQYLINWFKNDNNIESDNNEFDWEESDEEIVK
ncbi:18413_t:CDS:2 [Funneliformis geosporum]|nr:18413_t:CDS:2 [Funneliformis geosporum]